MFWYIIIIVFFMALAAVGILKTTLWMVSKMGHKYVETTHRSAEYIINTGSVPPFWFTKENKKSGLFKSPFLLKVKCLKKLRKIISYFEGSTIAGDEKTRAVVVSKLTEVYNAWTDKEWDELKPL